MDGPDHHSVVVERRKSLKERLRLTGIGCCGATWSFGPPNNINTEEEGGRVQQQQELEIGPATAVIESTPECSGQTPARSGMNLATALEAERQFRAGVSPSPSPNPVQSPTRPGQIGTPGTTPYRVSLMRLLEQTDAWGEEEEEKEKPLGSDTVCCVCMVRKKGAAFIPCGHTFCRVCSRELWLNRGTCPLCTRFIVEILDIF